MPGPTVDGIRTLPTTTDVKCSDRAGSVVSDMVNVETVLSCLMEKWCTSFQTFASDTVSKVLV